MDDAELIRRFHERIVPRLFSAVSPARNPVTILLGGQPGAGKTVALERVVSVYPAGEVVSIDLDDLRRSHPDYRQLVKDDPARMPGVTAQAAGSWVQMCVEHANQHGYSALVEGTWRDPQVPLRTVDQAHQAGRQVHAVALAVPEDLSRLSTLERYYRPTEAGRSARWTPPEVHAQAVARLPDAVAKLAVNPHVDRFTVADRDGAVRDWDRYTPERGAEAIAIFRARTQRDLTAEEHAHATATAQAIQKAFSRDPHTRDSPLATREVTWASERFAPSLRPQGASRAADADQHQTHPARASSDESREDDLTNKPASGGRGRSRRSGPPEG